MTALLSTLHGAETVYLTATRIWGVASELFTAPALLRGLDTMALVRLQQEGKEQPKTSRRKQREENPC